MKEQIDHPDYYKLNGRECIDLMIEEFGIDAVINFCKCNEYKYLFRAGRKSGNSKEQDEAKAKWYSNKCSELVSKRLHLKCDMEFKDLQLKLEKYCDML